MLLLVEVVLVELVLVWGDQMWTYNGAEERLKGVSLDDVLE